MKMYLPPPGQRNTRRGFLKKGLFGGLVLALGGGGWLLSRPSVTTSVPEGLKVLSEREFAVMHTLVQRFVPAHATFPSPDLINTTVACDAILAMTEEVTQTEVKQLLMLFENALPNFLFGRRTKPFTQLDVDDQDAVLAEWRDSKLTLRRTGFTALRGTVLAAYYGNKDTWAAVGYSGPPAGIFDPEAPVWRGGDTPRPAGNGTYVEPEPTPAPEATP